MEVFNLDAVTTAVLLGTVAGVIELVKRVFAKDWEAVVIIAGAGGAGALTALLMALDPLIGMTVGLAASGYITIAQNVGKEA